MIPQQAAVRDEFDLEKISKFMLPSVEHDQQGRTHCGRPCPCSAFFPARAALCKQSKCMWAKVSVSSLWSLYSDQPCRSSQ